jgi:hypothetical protein
MYTESAFLADFGVLAVGQPHYRTGGTGRQIYQELAVVRSFRFHVIEIFVHYPEANRFIES